MTLHAFIQYLKHRLKAKGRHGTHSPFVYRFVERVLMDKSAYSFNKKLEEYFKDYTIIHAKNWDNLLPVKNTDIILLEGIHQTAQHTAAWEKLCNAPSVKMSIDMYHYGMLLSLDEFKEKQHFILKNPG